MLYLYDLHGAVAAQVQSMVQGTWLLAHFRQGHLERRLRPGRCGGVDDAHLADLPQLLPQRRPRPTDPPAIELTPQPTAQHQRQHAVEDMDLDLLVGPMPLRTQRQVLDML